MMGSGKRLNLYYQNPKPAVLADPALISEKFWRELYGSCEPAPEGEKKMRTLSLVFRVLAVTALVLTVLVFVPISSQAAVVNVTGNNATSIEDLEIDGVPYDITFLFDTSYNVYGDPPQFPFQSDASNTEETSLAAAIAIREALNAASTKVLTVGPNQTDYYLLSVAEDTENSLKFHTGWESRYDVQSPNRPPGVWTAADNWDPQLLPPNGLYPFGVNVWPPDANYTFALAEFADGTPPPDVSIGGDVTGLLGSGLVLQNNGADDESIAADGPFTFDTQVTPNTSYTVTVATQPNSPAQSCTVAYGSGSVPGGGVDNVLVTCADVPPAPADTKLSGYLFANDFDGDSIVDRGVYRRVGSPPSTDRTTWLYYPSNVSTSFQEWLFGLQGDVPVAGDYDGNGQSDIAIFRDGLWRVLLSDIVEQRTVGLGLAGDVPVPGDYDGDGTTDPAIYRFTGQWAYLSSATGEQFGAGFGAGGPSEVPVPGDYDGDGITDIAIFRNGLWRILLSGGGPNDGQRTVGFGLPGDVPVPGDYDGDGITDPAIYRNGQWFALLSATGERLGASFPTVDGDVPVPADYDNDNRTDPAVDNLITGKWTFLPSSGGGIQEVFLVRLEPGDIPVNTVTVFNTIF
jgi:hypothetical protein